ncbi:thioredoxin family protein [Halomonas korlensis]|uniref:Small redox-active disulfide protein 2 n=1 Tax=Halomonas korlensis TaxID=463301 RepID=A0A1I7FGH4_9GAMM|nr:thioredoxin family protein [Halomonas korlensis]SFU35279.1 small redox-active disulfide protein 2 [Halomonas korlensis]
MKLSIYGKGCKKCEQLTANAQQAAVALGLAVEIEKVTDMNAIIDKGVMRTPALGIEGKVASSEELQTLLKG